MINIILMFVGSLIMGIGFYLFIHGDSTSPIILTIGVFTGGTAHAKSGLDFNNLAIFILILGFILGVILMEIWVNYDFKKAKEDEERVREEVRNKYK